MSACVCLQKSSLNRIVEAMPARGTLASSKSSALKTPQISIGAREASSVARFSALPLKQQFKGEAVALPDRIAVSYRFPTMIIILSKFGCCTLHVATKFFPGTYPLFRAFPRYVLLVALFPCAPLSTCNANLINMFSFTCSSGVPLLPFFRQR